MRLPDYKIDDICGACGATWGQHIGLRCPATEFRLRDDGDELTTLRSRLTEVERERDEAFARGAEWMREEAAKAVTAIKSVGVCKGRWDEGYMAATRDDARIIRSLPTTQKEVEG